MCSAVMQLLKKENRYWTLRHRCLTSSSTLYPVVMAPYLHEADLPVKQSAMLDHYIPCIPYSGRTSIALHCCALTA